VKFARLFALKIDQAEASSRKTAPAPPRESWWQSLTAIFAQPALKASFVVALLLLAGATLFLGVRWRAESNRIAVEQAAAQRREAERQAEEQRKQLEREQQQQQAAKDKQAEEERLAQQRGNTNGQNLVHALATIALLPGASRSATGGGHELLIGPEHKDVQITLREVPSDYAKFVVVVRTPEGRTVSTHEVVRKGANLTFSLPADRLATGDYIVHIDGVTSSGVDDVNDYSLRVRRNK
ncbi:MAG TPA: hypothetical protein VKB46_18705, partial [Pyrinomonadaceae bacterium]|nr:hypothetical protein [Pyrinomonadaceae bacterium]